MLDNFDVAVLSRANELAGRYGFKPYDFVATFQLHEEHGRRQWQLRYESGNLDDPKFSKMLDSLGIPDGVLSGSAESIYEALDNALAKAPKPRQR